MGCIAAGCRCSGRRWRDEDEELRMRGFEGLLIVGHGDFVL